MGLGWLRAAAQDYNYKYNYNKIELGTIFLTEFKEIDNKLGVGLGSLRAAPQGYTYNYNKITLESKFQNNLKVGK